MVVIYSVKLVNIFILSRNSYQLRTEHLTKWRKLLIISSQLLNKILLQQNTTEWYYMIDLLFLFAHWSLSFWTVFASSYRWNWPVLCCSRLICLRGGKRLSNDLTWSLQHRSRLEEDSVDLHHLYNLGPNVVLLLDHFLGRKKNSLID